MADNVQKHLVFRLSGVWSRPIKLYRSYRTLKDLIKIDIEWVHAHIVSVEIELKMDWQGCKQVYNFQILHLIGQ